MREELKKIQEELHITVVFVTHDQEEAMVLSHRIVVMNKGVIEQTGTPNEVYDHPASRFVASFIGEMNFVNDGDKVLAVRPENVLLSEGDKAGIRHGSVRTVMILGHYAEVTVDVNDQIVKAYVTRQEADRFHPHDEVSLQFTKMFEYAA